MMTQLVEKSHEELALTVTMTESWQYSNEELAEALLEVTLIVTLTELLLRNHEELRVIVSMTGVVHGSHKQALARLLEVVVTVMMTGSWQ